MSRVRFRSIAGIISLALLAGPVCAERHFRAHVSRPVFDPDSGDWLGVLILGLDVEAALSR